MARLLDDENIARISTAGAAIPQPQPQIDLQVAAEHYGDGMRRGLNADRDQFTMR